MLSCVHTYSNVCLCVYVFMCNTLSLKESLSQDLVALSTWIADNGLTMNTQKTQFMVLSKRGRDKEVEKLHIKVNGEVLRDGGPPTQLEGSRGSC